MPYFKATSIQENAFGFRKKLFYLIDRIEKLRETLGKEKHEIRILDFGCGSGELVTLPLGAEGYAVLGLDLHEPSIQHARKQNIFQNVEFVRGDLQNLQGKFDAVILSDILEHLDHPEKLLKEIMPFMNPHSIVLISIPNGYGPFEIENFILRKTRLLKLGRMLRKSRANLQTMNHESGHVQFFTRSRMESMVQNIGLKVTHFEQGSFLCGPVTSRIIGRFRLLTRLNLALGRRLPAVLSSVWYFELACRFNNKFLQAKS